MLKKDEFMKKYAGVYEHSPWIAEAAYAMKPESLEKLHQFMKAAVMSAKHDKKMELIRAHPDLACVERDLTAESTAEQKGAGLNQCTPEEFAEFQKLNAEYKKKFGFPFIIAVKGLTRTDILKLFRNRLGSNPGAEYETALKEIHKIAWFRLQGLG